MTATCVVRGADGQSRGEKEPESSTVMSVVGCLIQDRAKWVVTNASVPLRLDYAVNAETKQGLGRLKYELIGPLQYLGVS